MMQPSWSCNGKLDHTVTTTVPHHTHAGGPSPTCLAHTPNCRLTSASPDVTDYTACQKNCTRERQLSSSQAISCGTRPLKYGDLARGDHHRHVYGAFRSLSSYQSCDHLSPTPRGSSRNIHRTPHQSTLRVTCIGLVLHSLVHVCVFELRHI